MVLISMMVTPDLEFSFGKIVGTLYGISLFYAAVDWSRQRTDAIPLAAVTVVLGCGAAALGLLGTEWVIKSPLFSGVLTLLPPVIRGVPGAESGFNPNQVAGALIMLVPVQTATLWAMASDGALGRWRRIAYACALAAGLALTLGVVLLAQSRAALVALLLGLLLMSYVLLRRLRPALLLLLLAVTIILLVAGPQNIDQWFVQQGWMIETGSDSLVQRMELWQAGLDVLADHPLAGTGMNLFRRIARQRYPLFQFSLDRDIGHSHQTYLQVALDLGIPGLVFYLAALGGTLAVGHHSFHHNDQPGARLVALGGSVGLLVHAIWGMTDAVALGAKQGFLWWLMLALVIASAVTRPSAVPRADHGRKTT
jgi:O-antigen ligase